MTSVTSKGKGYEQGAAGCRCPATRPANVEHLVIAFSSTSARPTSFRTTVTIADQ